ncbi:MAG: hypothetical protein WBM99_06060 [Psychromonas sp.]
MISDKKGDPVIFNIIEVINEKRALEKYANKNWLLEDAVAYVGHPKQSASEPNKIFLRLNPLTRKGAFLEFKTEDVVYAEHQETIANSNGETFQIYKIWIRSGSIGVKLEQFTV